jgi:hypothetical protein
MPRTRDERVIWDEAHLVDSRVRRDAIVRAGQRSGMSFAASLRVVAHLWAHRDCPVVPCPDETEEGS